VLDFRIPKGRWYSVRLPQPRRWDAELASVFRDRPPGDVGASLPTRVNLATGAFIYAAVVWGVRSSMERGFDVTTRKLAGTR